MDNLAHAQAHWHQVPEGEQREMKEELLDLLAKQPGKQAAAEIRGDIHVNPRLIPYHLAWLRNSKAANR